MGYYNDNEIATMYKNYLLELAGMYRRLDEMHAMCDMISNKTGDEREPENELENVQLAMGKAIAAMINYGAEYEKKGGQP